MSKPKKPMTKGKGRQETNVEALVNSIASKNVPEYEKILLQLRVFKEKRMHPTALQLYKKGMQIIQHQLQNNNNHQSQIHLNIAKARFYHYTSSIFYELGKYLKAISYSTQSVNTAKGILDNSCIEMMRFREVLATSYKALQQNDEALAHFEPIYYGLNAHIITKQQQKKNQNKCNDPESKNTDNGCDNYKQDYSLQELQIWKGDITYNIAMICNSQKKFKKAAIYAKECCVVRNLFEANTSKLILALMLVSVIVSCPQIAEYKLALNNLEQAKVIIHLDKKEEQKKQNNKTYLPRIQKLSRTVLNECVRWSKVTNTNLEHYLKTGQRIKIEITKSNK